MDTLESRFRIVRSLGAGGGAEVFLAEDRRCAGSTVALKLARQRRPESEAAAREFSQLARLHHPHVVRVLDFGRLADGRLFLTTEFIEGTDLGHWADGRREGELAQVTVQVCRALQYLHGRGLVHGDLKPANILVEAGPCAKLVDFGLAASLAEQDRSVGVSGTLRFLAPEILEGARPSPASDLYGLGATLKEVLPPESALVEIQRWLMAEDPPGRPASARAVIDALGQRLGCDFSLTAEELAGPYFPRPPFVGREQVLAQLEAAQHGVMLIRGPDGAGKSSLLRELWIRALLRGQECLFGARSPLGGPLRGVATALGLTPPDGGLERESVDGVVDRVLSAIPREEGRPPLLLLDDVAGDDEVCLRLLDRLCTSPISCVATVGLREWGPRHQAVAAAASLLEIPGLSMRELEGLLHGMLPDQEHSSARVQEIYSATEGNPRLVEEMLRLAIESGQISPKEATYRLDIDLADLAALARLRLARLSQGARAALARLAIFLHGAPVELAPVPPELEARGLVVQAEGLWRVANPWLRAELLADLSDSDRAERHRAAADSLARISRPSLLLQLELGEQLAAGGNAIEAGVCFAEVAAQQAKSLDFSAAIQHYRRCVSLSPRGSEIRARALGEVARLARLSGNHEAALAAADELLVEVQGGELRLPAELSRVETLLARGHAEEATQTLEQLCRGVSGEAEARCRCAWARALIQRGDHRGAESQARSALRAAEDLPAVLRADLENIQGLCQMMQGADLEARRCFERAYALHRELGDRHGMARAANSRGLAAQRKGELAAASEAYQEALELARQTGDLQLQIVCTLNAGTAAQQASDFAQALQRYRDGLSLARSLCNEREIARLATNLGNLMLELGDLSLAEELLAEALCIAERRGLQDLVAHIVLFQAEAALLGRSFDRAARLAETSAGRFEALGRAPERGEAHLLLARVLSEMGQPGNATPWLRRALEADLSDALLARARLLEATWALASPSSDHRLARPLLEEALFRAHRAGAKDLVWLVHLRLSDVGDEPVDREYHRTKAGLAVQDLLQAVPAPYRGAFRSIHLDPAHLPSSPSRKQRDSPAGILDLLRINRELTREQRPDRVLEIILDRAIELTGAERGFVILAEGKKLRVAVARNMDQETVRRKGFKFSRSVAEKVVLTGEPVVTRSAEEDQRFHAVRSVHALHLRSILCVPLRMQAQILGALYLDNRFRRGVFGDQQVELLGAFADQAAIALTNARLLFEAEQRNVQLAEAKAEVESLNAQLRATVEAQAENLHAMTARLDSEETALLERYRGASLVGRSKAMCQILRLVDRVSGTDFPVVLQGETGTGKELVAKAIHYNSPRRGGPFVSINCAAIPAALLESELFGHARGSFTGAVRDKMGLLQVAAGGTLLLDEVGDMPREMQAKLLRVLQEGRYRRIGEEQERVTDARVISASLHDLRLLVEAGRFRQDLYFRLNVMLLTVPPLRDRPEDIPDLVEHFLAQISPRPVVDRTTMALLLRYPWPGNVRELQNELCRAAALCDGTITPEILSPRLWRTDVAAPTVSGMAQVVGAAEKAAIERALDRTGGSATHAARLLGISRVVLHRKLKKHGITRLRPT